MLCVGSPVSLRQSASGNVLDADGNQHTYLNTWNTGPWQQWVLVDRGEGWYEIKQVRTGLVLDCTPGRPLSLLPQNYGDYQRWRLTNRGDGCFSIEQKATGLVLDCTPGRQPALNKWNTGPFQKWVVAPVSLKVTRQVLLTSFGEMKAGADPRKVDLAIGTTFNVLPGGKYVHEYTFRQTQASTFGVEFDQSFGAESAFAASVTAETPVPGLAATASASKTFSITIGFQQSYAQTSQVEYVVTDAVEQKYPYVRGDPNYGKPAEYKVTAWLNWMDNIVVPFTVSGVFRASNSGVEFPNDQLQAYLIADGFTGRFNGVDQNGDLRFEIDGTLTGSYGIDSGTNTEQVVVSA